MKQAIIIAAFFPVLALGAFFGEAQRATYECNRWAEWENDFPAYDARSGTGYSITSWQKEQCDTYGISLQAPVVD